MKNIMDFCRKNHDLYQLLLPMLIVYHVLMSTILKMINRQNVGLVVVTFHENALQCCDIQCFYFHIVVHVPKQQQLLHLLLHQLE